MQPQGLHRPIVLAIHVLLMGAAALALAAPFSPVLAANPSALSAAERQFDIPPGALHQVLGQFAAQAGIALTQQNAVPPHLSSPGLQGAYSVQAGLQQLLAGTGLAATASGANQYRISKPSTAASEAGVLDEVTVTAPATSARLTEVYAGGQLARGGQVGLLGNQDFMDTPFSTTAYTEAYIQDIQASDIGSVIGSTDASVYVPQTRGIQESFLMRGFSVSGLNDMYFNGLAGMAPLMRGSTEMYERIEVQKGPAAMLSGMAPDGSVGGTINLVPKRAGDEPLTRLTGSYESDSVFGLHADIGRRFGERKQLGVRFNGVVRDGDTAVHDQQHSMALGALALDWRSERVRISGDLYRQRERLDGANYFGISTIAAAVTQLPKPFDGSTNLAAPWSYAINNTTTAMARAEWDISDAVTAYAAYGRREGTYDTLITGSSLLNDAGDVSTSVTRQYYRQIARSGEVGVRATLNTAAVKHAVSLAGTTYRAEYGATAARAAAPLTNINALDYGSRPDFSSFSRAKPEMLLRTELNSVALADRMSVLDDRVQLTLGVRHQKVHSTPLTAYAQALASNYRQSAWSPSAALLLKPTEQLSLYGSYIQGLSQGDTAPATAANAYEQMSPYKTKQYELGAKYDWGQVAATLALYQISKPSSYTDPVTNIYARSGEQRNRGIELNVFGQATGQLRLLGGLSYTQATLRNQLVQTNNGNQASGVPKFIARLGAEYDLHALPGLVVNGGLNQVGKRYATADNRLTAAAYTTFDVGARYATQLAGTPVTLRANVDNLFNKAYWAGTLGSGLGAPRSFKLSVTADF